MKILILLMTMLFCANLSAKGLNEVKITAIKTHQTESLFGDAVYNYEFCLDKRVNEAVKSLQAKECPIWVEADELHAKEALKAIESLGADSVFTVAVKDGSIVYIKLLKGK